MKLGIVGLPRSGKTTLFSALTGRPYEELVAFSKSGSIQGVVPVPDERLEWLAERYHPKRAVPAMVTYFDFHGGTDTEDKRSYISMLLTSIRPLDALIMVVRNFNDPVLGAPDVIRDFRRLEEEFLIADLSTVEKRLERIEQERKKGRRGLDREAELLYECNNILSREEPLRNYPAIAVVPELRGFTFLTAKPLLVVVNNEDFEEVLPNVDFKNVDAIAVRARLEMEILQLPQEEVESFKESFGLKILARDLLIKRSYSLLRLITFFTIGEDEVRAWTIPEGTTALKAAGTIHSDMEKGFIRAEVVAYDDLRKTGSYNAAKREGLVRLEGKDYVVHDGDILHIRFGAASSTVKK
ncbi:MAG: YchF family ATPase [Syntrophobacterales bacterium]|nr:YchF family ATPase [Syntrophobacterales bacterium]